MNETCLFLSCFTETRLHLFERAPQEPRAVPRSLRVLAAVAHVSPELALVERLARGDECRGVCEPRALVERDAEPPELGRGCVEVRADDVRPEVGLRPRGVSCDVLGDAHAFGARLGEERRAAASAEGEPHVLRPA